MIFEITEQSEEKTSIRGEFVLKGLVRVLDNCDFEVLNEELFYTGFEKNGFFLNQRDIGFYLSYEFKQMYDNKELFKKFNPGDMAGIYFKFDLINSSDPLVEEISLEIIKIAEPLETFLPVEKDEMGSEDSQSSP